MSRDVWGLLVSGLIGWKRGSKAATEESLLENTHSYFPLPPEVVEGGVCVEVCGDGELGQEAGVGHSWKEEIIITAGTVC